MCGTPICSAITPEPGCFKRADGKMRLNPDLQIPEWLRAEIIRAHRDNVRAKWMMRRCENALSRALDADENDEGAYDRCGVGLADIRSLGAYQRLQKASRMALIISQHYKVV